MDQNESAFPVRQESSVNYGIFQEAERGMSKREYFAVMALSGYMVNSERNGSAIAYATDAVRFADALIEALNKPKA